MMTEERSNLFYNLEFSEGMLPIRMEEIKAEPLVPSEEIPDACCLIEIQ